MVYCECDRLFTSTRAQEQHRKARIQNRQNRSYGCPVICCRSFSNPHSLSNHQKSKDHWSSQEEKANALGDKVCPCGKVCRTAEGLEQHKNSMKHLKRMKNMSKKITPPVTEIQNPSKVQVYMDEFYENNVKVKKDDRKESVATVRETLSTIMEHVRRQTGGEIYNPGLRKAGSHAVQTKIGKADEFDWSVPLNVTTEDIVPHTKGSIPYTFDAQVRMEIVVEKEGAKQLCAFSLHNISFISRSSLLHTPWETLYTKDLLVVPPYCHKFYNFRSPLITIIYFSDTKPRQQQRKLVACKCCSVNRLHIFLFYPFYFT